MRAEPAKAINVAVAVAQPHSIQGKTQSGQDAEGTVSKMSSGFALLGIWRPLTHPFSPMTDKSFVNDRSSRILNPPIIETAVR